MNHLVPLSDAVREIRAEHRDLIEEFVAWSATRGRPADPDIVALLCGATTGRDGQGSLAAWDRRRTHHMMRIDVPNWCSSHCCLWPNEVPEVLWDWFGFLAATGRLDEGSDPVWELRKPLVCYGGLDFEGRPRPADDLRTLVPCECFLPYRETVEAVQGLLDGSLWVEDVFDALDPSGEMREARYDRLRDLDTFGLDEAGSQGYSAAADVAASLDSDGRITRQRAPRSRGTSRPGRSRGRRS